MKPLSIRLPTRSRQRLPVAVERRKKSWSNYLRRFFNDFWLVPLVVIYLQLMAALMGADGRSGTLAEQNRTFFSGIPLVTAIVTHDFPYTILGHGKQMLHRFASSNLTAPEAVANAIVEQRHQIYADMIASQAEQRSEIGGVVSTQPNGGLTLYPIESSNVRFLNTLTGISPTETMAVLNAPEHADMLDALASNPGTLQRVTRIVTSDRFSDSVKRDAVDSVLFALEVASEARYVVLPVDFKSTLGHMGSWSYAGVYHYHNELNSPPSDVDMASSYEIRQFIFCLAVDGFDLYDVYQGRSRMTHFVTTDDPSQLPGQSQNRPLGTAL